LRIGNFVSVISMTSSGVQVHRTGDEDVSQCSLPWRKLENIADVWVTKKDTQPPRRLTFVSLSILHEVGAQSLVVDLKGGLHVMVLSTSMP
jgi:hypothetical protein